MIPPATLARIKEQTDIVALVAETVRLVRRGRSFLGLCPFHQEKTPSFQVNAERGHFHCFGCGEDGSAIDFLMKLEGHAFPDAARALAERLGIEIEEALTDDERREAHAARRARDDLFGVGGLAVMFFERCLQEHPLARYARAELARRALEPASPAAKAFRIGYAPFGWDGLTTFFREQGVSLTTGEKVGLLAQRRSGGGHYDRFRHRLMFPVLDVMGRVVAFSGRALEDPSPDVLRALSLPAHTTPGEGQEPPAKYINSPESPIYTKGEHLFGLHQARKAVRERGEAVMVEGNFDVVSLHARGVENVVAPLGTALTLAQARLLKRYCPSVVLLFDGDAAGHKAARAARTPCREGGLSARVGCLPSGSDPDELVRLGGPKAIRALVKGARGMVEYLLDETLDAVTFATLSLEERAERVRLVLQILREEQEPILHGMVKLYADHVASRIVVAGRPPTGLFELERAIAKAIGAQRVLSPPPASPPLVGPAAGVLGAVLDFPALLQDAEVQDGLGVLEGDLAFAVGAVGGRGGPVELEAFPESMRAFVGGRLAAPAIDDVTLARRILLGSLAALGEGQGQGDDDARLLRLFEEVR